MARRTPAEREPSGDVPPIMNVRQAAKLLGLSPYTVREFARDGKIPAKKVGRAWRFSRDALIRWLETPDPYRHKPGTKPKGYRPPDPWGQSPAEPSSALDAGSNQGGKDA